MGLSTFLNQYLRLIELTNNWIQSKASNRLNLIDIVTLFHESSTRTTALSLVQIEHELI